MATNKIESLDPALLRPGRLDRKIEFPLPNIKTKRRIFQVIFLLLHDPGYLLELIGSNTMMFFKHSSGINC